MEKVALVTGGSRGLGSAISLALADNGAKVAINYRSRTKEAKDVQEQIVKKGGKAEIFKGEVTDEENVKQICEAVVHTFGPIDILVVKNATLVMFISQLKHSVGKIC